MDTSIKDPGFWTNPDWFTAAFDYWLDSCQRSVLFADIMRKRGNMYLEHARLGHPPVLIFDYEMVVDGRIFDKPVNYSLIRILERRDHLAAKKAPPSEIEGERRAPARIEEPSPADKYKRPIVVIDPRAGHGPGIGGSKLDSQIGVALNAGHPVYFIMFYPDPEPGQSLSDIQQAEVKFLEEVIRRHPDAERPAIIGNCQAGWATALIGADRPDVTGPMVFNGSPLSYWGGMAGANPMRYRGGLCGGAWLTSLLSDLGNGEFDGANLVAGFEDLDPANTLWSKNYHVYANVDTEEKRYLDFEKWWGGFFKMNREEIHFIVNSLFVGNELEHGQLQLDKDKIINLKNFKDPIVVFASAGDNITPPQQALNWIYKVYRTVDEIKRNGQVIVYILHPKIGHLGIFVGSKVARKEHSAIIGSVDMIEYLAPGLYEMVITDSNDGDETETRQVAFQERDMSDILKLDDGLEDEEAFSPVAAVSRFNDKLYLSFVSPLVQMMINEPLAESIRQLHPLRTQRYMFSDANPLLWPIQFSTPWIKQYRRKVKDDNPFLLWEKSISGMIKSSLDGFRNYRDQYQENIFKLMYDNPWMKTLYPDIFKKNDDKGAATVHSEQNEIEKKLWQEVMVQGGFVAAIVRIILIVSMADKSVDMRQFIKAQQLIQSHEQLKRFLPVDIKRHVKEQAAIVTYDPEAAIATLPKLLKRKKERLEAYEIATLITVADLINSDDEKAILEKLKKTLKV
jgi:tellurite resistance protein